MSEGTVTMELDDAALDEVMNDISCSLEHDVDPFSLFIGDNVDEARLAVLTWEVGNVAQGICICDRTMTKRVERDLLEPLLVEIVVVCVVWLVQISEQTIGQTTSEVLDHIKWFVPSNKPFSADIQGRPLSRLVQCLAEVLDHIPAADSRGGPENCLVAMAGQTVRWILELRTGQQP